MRDRFNRYIEKLQDKITSKLADLDSGAIFKEDFWEREGGGGGRTRVIENGAVFEKAGLVGCLATDEQLSTNYKTVLDYSQKHSS